MWIFRISSFDPESYVSQPNLGWTKEASGLRCKWGPVYTENSHELFVILESVTYVSSLISHEGNRLTGVTYGGTHLNLGDISCKQLRHAWKRRHIVLPCRCVTSETSHRFHRWNNQCSTAISCCWPTFASWFFRLRSANADRRVDYSVRSLCTF